jgi:hypothetical protein
MINVKPLKAMNFEADETEKAELTYVSEHFEVEVQRKKSKVLKVSRNVLPTIL